MKQGLIWVWAESGPVAFIESAAAPPVVDPLREQAESWSGGFTNYVRDVPGCATKQLAASYVRVSINLCARLHVPRPTWWYHALSRKITHNSE